MFEEACINLQRIFGFVCFEESQLAFIAAVYPVIDFYLPCVVGVDYLMRYGVPLSLMLGLPRKRESNRQQPNSSTRSLLRKAEVNDVLPDSSQALSSPSSFLRTTPFFLQTHINLNSPIRTPNRPQQVLRRLLDLPGCKFPLPH